MYSGVAGLRTHQYRMDAIGNNVANVNTYGYKSSRATFRDVYYQAVNGASAPTGNKGGINPSAIGYGSQIASIDVMHGQSSFTNTGNAFDVAIAGDGFLQVMDADGNIYYTKAGMLGIDSQGNVVDSNGNFVLGVSGDPLGKSPDSQKISINLPALNPAAGSKTQMINNVNYTLKASNETDDSNVNFTFLSSSKIPQGKQAEAVLTSSGITITFGSTAEFKNLGEVQTAINDAIREANGGKDHVAGMFTLTSDVNVDQEIFAKAPGGVITGADLVSDDTSAKLGKVELPAATFKDNAGATVSNGPCGRFTFLQVGSGFTAGGMDPGGTPAAVTAMTLTHNFDANTTDGGDFTVSMTINGVNYEGVFSAKAAASGCSVLLRNGTSTTDTITLQCPSLTAIVGESNLNTDADADNDIEIDTSRTDLGITTKMTFNAPDATTLANLTASPTTPAYVLGLGSKPFKLEGGTAGGPQTVKDLSGISIGADGVISAFHPLMDPQNFEIGRIDLVVFDNMSGLNQSGSTYFTSSTNSGEPKVVKAGTTGAGEIKSSALEMSNVDLAQEFSDVITTQRGFQANSRLITVSDTMLEELVNLKR